MYDNLISPVINPDSAPTQRILVVDDDEDIRRLNCEALIHSGYAVDGAEDGAVAWDALQVNSYDLLVTDNGMPQVSGLALLKKMHAAHLELPVIMATGKLPNEEFARCPWLQPVATLIKPYTIGELLWTVKEVLHATDVAPRADRGDIYFRVMTGTVASQKI